MTTDDLRKTVASMRADCINAVKKLTGPQRELAEGNCPSLTWNEKTLKEIGLRPLKMAHNNLSRLIGKLSPDTTTKQR